MCVSGAFADKPATSVILAVKGHIGEFANSHLNRLSMHNTESEKWGQQAGERVARKILNEGGKSNLC